MSSHKPSTDTPAGKQPGSSLTGSAAAQALHDITHNPVVIAVATGVAGKVTEKVLDKVSDRSSSQPPPTSTQE